MNTFYNKLNYYIIYLAIIDYVLIGFNIFLLIDSQHFLQIKKDLAEYQNPFLKMKVAVTSTILPVLLVIIHLGRYLDSTETREVVSSFAFKSC